MAEGRTGRERGATLFELLVVILLVGIIAGSVQQLVGSALSSADDLRTRHELLAQARFALSRITLFVRESDAIAEPALGTSGERLSVSERSSDRYNNATCAYQAAGDGIPDADNDRNGLVNEGGADPPEWASFTLDRGVTGNWRLLEQLPDYGTSATGDYRPQLAICEQVLAFSCTRLSAGQVEIALTVGRGATTVTLRTRARARLLSQGVR